MRPLSGLATILVGGATALVLLAVAIGPFLSPAWVSFEQGRANAAAWTGFAPADLERTTNAILADLVLGPPDFDVALDGVPVLTAAERGHMRDVRGVFAGFYAGAAIGVLLLIAGWVASSRSTSWTRSRFWAAVRRGAIALAGLMVVAGVVAGVAFDAAFEVFHRLFFAAGTYNFDPATDRLVQLFPDVFWSETAIVVGGVTLVLALATAFVASRRLSVRRPAADPASLVTVAR
jgi:integral membrane protein (TIGR01906 family)